jgi:hypothetical protein
MPVLNSVLDDARLLFRAVQHGDSAGETPSSMRP